jgi:hypothetical protein
MRAAAWAEATTLAHHKKTPVLFLASVSTRRCKRKIGRYRGTLTVLDRSDERWLGA